MEDDGCELNGYFLNHQLGLYRCYMVASLLVKLNVTCTTLPYPLKKNKKMEL
jgi:hypothetical protein